MRSKGWLSRLLAGLALYFALLAALTLAEQGNEASSIRSFADALWYSLVTLSTVGYGDFYPVTLLGKLIGSVFVLLSVGALAVIVGAVVSALTGNMLPRLKMWLLRHRNWYVFSQVNDGSVALARSLVKQEPDAVLLFPMADKEKLPTDLNCCLYPGSIAKVAGSKKENCSLLIMNECGDNLTLGRELLTCGHHIYCATEQTLDKCPEKLHLFDPFEACARAYWSSHGLKPTEKTIVLIGDGSYARYLLEQGLRVNILGGKGVGYHLFGNWDDFLRCHSQLGLTLAVGQQENNGDSVVIHSTPWNAEEALLMQADRILLCADEDSENGEVLQKLRRYFPVSGAVHLRRENSLGGEETFGSVETIYRAENVLAGKLNAAARNMHEIYRQSAGTAPAWEELSEFTRQSNIAAADHLLVKVRLLLEDWQITELTSDNCRAAYERYQGACPEQREAYRAMEHLRWMRFHSLYNWRYGPVRDNGARIHPMLLPYEALSPQEQAKDDYAWELLASLAQVLQ